MASTQTRSQAPGAASETTRLEVSSRDPDGSRTARRLRRTGQVPGVLYGGDGGPISFAVDARALRLAIASSGAVLDLCIDGAAPTPVVLKEVQRDPVRGETVHIDLLRVRLDKPISAVVPLELIGVEDAPGVKEGGILEQITRELNIEALPTAIPPSITHEVSEMVIGDTITLSAVHIPPGVTLLDDAEETVLATLTPPRLQAEVEAELAALEVETELVGEEGAEAPEGEEAEAPEGEEAEAPEGDGSAGGRRQGPEGSDSGTKES